MVTKSEALTADRFHYCDRWGEYKGTFRRNGKTQTWKCDPARFRVPVKFVRVPVKYGFYGYAEITHENAADWHTEDNCPSKIKERDQTNEKS